jgi:CRISPR/Cas system CSM-associated protein Csm2 small subunit
MINVFKRGLSVARRLKPDLPAEDFYIIIDEVLSQCVRGGRVDLDEFEQLLKSYIAKHEVRGADPQAEARRRIEGLLQDVKERLVDYAMKLEKVEEFEELFNAWSNEILSEVRFWRDIAEKTRSIDFGKLIRSIRLSRKRRPDLLPALKGEVCQR